MERILLEENTALAKEIKSDLQQFKPVLSELKRTYEALELGIFTNDVFKTLLLIGTKQTTELYVKNLNSQLDEMNITSQIIRANLIADHDKIVNNLVEALQKAKAFVPEVFSANFRQKLSLKYISFVNNQFCISDIDNEKILEDYCRIYVESEEEHKIYNICENLKKAFNDYLSVIKDCGLNTTNKTNTLTYILRDKNENDMEVKPFGIKYISSYKKAIEEQKNTFSR